MKAKFSTLNVHESYAYQREDVLDEFLNMSRQKSHLRRRSKQRVSTLDDSSHLNQIRLNKKKKYQLQEQKNTQIDRSNRILYEKIAKAGRVSQPSTVHTRAAIKSHKKNKVKTSPAAGQLNQKSRAKQSRSIHQSRQKNQPMTLFMGHDFIDEVQFKIKLVIANGVYYLIAQNQHSKIILEMPQEEYWDLHYGELQENPCHIFPYLQIHKGQISFRVKGSKKGGSLPKGVSRVKVKDRVSLPRI